MLISKRHKLGTPAWFKTMHYYSDLGNLGKQCSKGQTMMKSSVLAVAEKGLKLFWFFVCLLSVQKSASRNSFFRNMREYILKEMCFSAQKRTFWCLNLIDFLYFDIRFYRSVSQQWFTGKKPHTSFHSFTGLQRPTSSSVSFLMSVWSR